MRPPGPLHVVLLLTAAAAVLGPVWAVFLYRSPPEWQATDLEQLAENACKCAHTRSDGIAKGRCWSQFDRLTHGSRKTADVAGCYPISLRMLPVPGSNTYFTVGYSVTSDKESFAPDAICTKAEALAREALYIRAMDESRSGAQGARLADADMAIVRFAHDLLLGADFTPAPPTGGCASSNAGGRN